MFGPEKMQNFENHTKLAQLSLSFGIYRTTVKPVQWTTTVPKLLSFFNQVFKEDMLLDFCLNNREANCTV